jgi:hypothetical protein
MLEPARPLLVPDLRERQVGASGETPRFAALACFAGRALGVRRHRSFAVGIGGIFVSFMMEECGPRVRCPADELRLRCRSDATDTVVSNRDHGRA